MPNPSAIESISPADLPIPPEGAFRIIHACNQKNADALMLGQLLEQDPVLSIEILRIANSAYFGFRGKITSVARAITVIGHRTLRHIVLCVAMRDALKPEQLPTLSVETFWASALRRAVCAKLVANPAGLDPDIAFTVVLLQDFGLLVLFFLFPNRIAEWPELSELAPDERYAMERQLFDTTHDMIGKQLAESWDLPPTLSLAMGSHHQLPTEDQQANDAKFCRLAQCTDWMAAVFTCADTHRAISQCRTLLSQHFALDADQADQLLARINDEVAEAAAAFGYEIDEQPAFEQLIQQANLRLVEDNLSIQELNWKLEQVLMERDQAAADLKQELDLAREVQRSLFPPESRDGICAHGLNLSAKAVSGDFYDFFSLRDGRVFFCIADVSGKGMHAALLMAKASSLFHCLGKSIPDPAKLLTMINRELFETSIRGMFITLVAGVINPQTTEVSLCNAGHPSVIRMRHNHIVGVYPADGPPLGITAETLYENRSFRLGEDALYLYTDGLLEARLQDGRRQNQEGLNALFAAHADKPPVQRLQHIVAALRREDGQIEDDMTLLLIEAES
jgi:serine phosphatase RsbU (regulator of sigma subunit)